MSKVLVLLNRNLRVQDNLCLQAARDSGCPVLVAFHFNEEQLTKHDFQSTKRKDVLFYFLKQLQNELRQVGSDLHFLRGDLLESLSQFCDQHIVKQIYTPLDVSPFARQREKKLHQHFSSKISFVQDLFLNAPQEILKTDASNYSVFTAYARKAMSRRVAPPCEFMDFKFLDNAPSDKLEDFLNTSRHAYPKNPPYLHESIDATRVERYTETRDIPSLEGTSRLSTLLRFGRISPRQVFDQHQDQDDFLRQLYWRDFFSQILFHHPRVLSESFHKKYQKIPWENSQEKFKLWCQGQTGFPLVDAGMRELNATGWMHNRVRMVTASFLVKDLHIDYKWGERYFAQKLLDYDIAINNGNWQWCASTGCDAQPYFRIFNPWLQQKRFDPEALYIKKWVPELRNLSPKEIHKQPAQLLSPDYPSPLVEHSKQSQKIKLLYQQCAAL